MMRLLLDTNVLIWALSNPSRLGISVQNVLAAPQNEVWLSPASPFEIAIKINTGKLSILAGFSSFEQMMEEAERILGFEILPFTVAHAATLSRLPMLHRDPFDRLMIAQALTDGFTLVSADEAFAQYAGISLLRV